MTIKNNVTRMLDARKIPYQTHALPQEKLGAAEAAQVLGVPMEQMFKTIVALPQPPGKPILALVSANQQVDTKSIARALKLKKIKITSQAQAENITGLQTGGISPLALINKGFQVILDQSALKYPGIYISGGQRGINIQLAPQDLIEISQAKTFKIAK